MSTSEKPTLISGMFEDIKKMITGLADKIGQTPTNSEVEPMLFKIEKSVTALEARNNFTPGQSAELKKYFNVCIQYIEEQISKKDSADFGQLCTMFGDISAKLNTCQKTVIRKERAITCDFKNGRAPLAIAILGSLFSLTLAGNYCQYQFNRQYRDNDLKYRYIKMKGGISAERLGELQTFFGYARDEAEVKNLRSTVEQYEQTVAEQAERIEQARLNAIQAEQLQQEADALKNRK